MIKLGAGRRVVDPQRSRLGERARRRDGLRQLKLSNETRGQTRVSFGQRSWCRRARTDRAGRRTRRPRSPAHVGRPRSTAASRRSSSATSCDRRRRRVRRACVQCDAVDAVAHDLGRAGRTEHERDRTGGHRLDDGDAEVLETLGMSSTDPHRARRRASRSRLRRAARSTTSPGALTCTSTGSPIASRRTCECVLAVPRVASTDDRHAPARRFARCDGGR